MWRDMLNAVNRRSGGIGPAPSRLLAELVDVIGIAKVRTSRNLTSWSAGRRLEYMTVVQCAVLQVEAFESLQLMGAQRH